MSRSKLLRALTVAGTIALSAVATTPAAHAAASACTHDWSGPQICIETSGQDGFPNPGTVTATWTNPPKSRQSATVYITTPGVSYSFKAKRSGSEIVGRTAPGLQGTGDLCVRFKGSSHKACVELIDRNGSF
ncbi:hypothetical protein [Streptomyces sp. NEAU-L66]|uniref:hypothetical protein n=1 Tax=Streptomyces sp. NEAU-L66 TaxID=3390812 RepID=UPI0039C6839E